MSTQFRTMWTRGNGCAELAQALDADAIRVTGDLTRAAVGHRADLLVARRFSPSFDTVSTAVPFDFNAESVRAVAALVSSGPHSALATTIAHRVGTALGVPIRVESAYENDGDQVDALNVVEQLGRLAPGAEVGIIQAESAAKVAEAFGEETLIVLGAPGGSFIQRHFFGTGARLISHAPMGAIGVKAAPIRAFRSMTEAQYVSPYLAVTDALAVMEGDSCAVVDGGEVIGLVSRRSLVMVGDVGRVLDCMGDAIVVHQLDPIEDVTTRMQEAGVSALPVVDKDTKLLGTVHRHSVGRDDD